MSETSVSKTPPRSFWIVGWIALVWNLIGIVTYWTTVTLSQDALNAMPEPERALQANVPFWVTSAYAVAVFGGTLACVGLLMRKAWATPLFIVSLAGILLQMGHALFGTDMLEVLGVTAAIVPVLIIIVAIYLVGFSRSAQKQSYIA